MPGLAQASFLDALLLGVIEGITEFLPVSSTGHLILANHWLKVAVEGKVFEIVVQLGAILAVVWLYRRKFLGALTGFTADASARHFLRNILVAFVPAMVAGALAHGVIKSVLFNPTVVAIALIVGGFAILLVERIKPAPVIESTEAMPLRTALLVGLFQCLSLIPGVSRAGATILGAMLCRVSRPAAAEFSFFLAVPTMAAATAYDMYKNYHVLSADGLELIAVGFIAAFATALMVVTWLVRFVQHHGFQPFAYYRIAAGVLMLVII